MAKLPRTFYVASGTRVMIGGKSPEMIEADLAAGVARVGGFWREPCYFESYLHGAQALIDKGIAEGNLDDVGLPAFYLQRHALELLLKSILEWLHGIEDLQQQCKDLSFKPDLEKRMYQVRKHNHHALLNLVMAVADRVGMPRPPAGIGTLVKRFSAFETTDTWARYGKSFTNTGDAVRHQQDEVAIPLVELQEDLEVMAANVVMREFKGGCYLSVLADQWSALHHAVEHLKGVPIDTPGAPTRIF